MDVQQQPLDEDLKHVLILGLGQHAKEVTGFDEKFIPVAFVASEAGLFVGAVVVELFWGALHVKYVFVEKDYRGRGVATQLMKKAFDFGRAEQCPFAFVETMSFQALEFYQGLGFALDFTRSGYKHGTSFHYLTCPLT